MVKNYRQGNGMYRYKYETENVRRMSYSFQTFFIRRWRKISAFSSRSTACWVSLKTGLYNREQFMY